MRKKAKQSKFDSSHKEEELIDYNSKVNSYRNCEISEVKNALEKHLDLKIKKLGRPEDTLEFMEMMLHKTN